MLGSPEPSAWTRGIAVREGRYKEAYGQLSSSLALDFERTAENTIFGLGEAQEVSKRAVMQP